ncbi:hypothetical protein D2T29_03485 [Sinirhodobacter populi]|uniref:Uncharacterized protein n=1 Tax=Paenirhodobacter populi TaxID=2306993 RepID=A0A443KP92_9RHOB|nr:hypothetical protein [Sinirhodobacter populi]RWR34619.1 hypothetical protein D2T29_03485 [Sinirhodobacter populi]
MIEVRNATSSLIRLVWENRLAAVTQWSWQLALRGAKPFSRARDARIQAFVGLRPKSDFPG